MNFCLIKVLSVTIFMFSLKIMIRMTKTNVYSFFFQLWFEKVNLDTKRLESLLCLSNVRNFRQINCLAYLKQDSLRQRLAMYCKLANYHAFISPQ